MKPKILSHPKTRKLAGRAARNVVCKEVGGQYKLRQIGEQEILGTLYEREFAELVVLALRCLCPALNEITRLEKRVEDRNSTITRLIQRLEEYDDQDES